MDRTVMSNAKQERESLSCCLETSSQPRERGREKERERERVWIIEELLHILPLPEVHSYFIKNVFLITILSAIILYCHIKSPDFCEISVKDASMPPE